MDNDKIELIEKLQDKVYELKCMLINEVEKMEQELWTMRIAEKNKINSELENIAKMEVQ